MSHWLPRAAARLALTLIPALALTLNLLPTHPATAQAAPGPAARAAYAPAGSPTDWVPGRVLVKTCAPDALSLTGGQLHAGALWSDLGAALTRFGLTTGIEIAPASDVYALAGDPSLDVAGAVA